MIINIKNKKDLITLDFNLKQIRIIDTRKKGWNTIKGISFIPLSNNDIEGYEYFIRGEKLNNTMFKKQFLKVLCEDLKDSGLNINIKDLEILK